VKYELTPGEVLGKYEILRKLAVGGMAEIYLARTRGNAGFEKVVVLKRILPQVAEDPTFVQMFLEEARLAATLNHPNVAHVYDVGEVDGQHFFTMEFVHGQDVRSIRHEMKKREEAVPLPISLAVIHGTAAALHYAHERTGPDGRLLGLVHRDVSASNVMVSYDGAIKLLDFGIARAASSTHKTQVGTLKGKVPYMSPEQCKGHPLDRRSDLFSLGIVLFELTVGRRPFRGESDFAIMDQIVYKGAPRPSSIQPDYPPELEAIVMKLLEREPKARYTTGEELIEDLDGYIQRHQLWISPTKIGKYMRGAFADRIAAWEEAEQQGVPFSQHVAHSITSQSQRSELVTPPSAFPGLPSKSAEIAAAAPPGSMAEEPQWEAPTRRQSQSMSAVTPPADASPKRTPQPMAAVPPPAMPVPQRRTPQPMGAVPPPAMPVPQRRTSQPMAAVAPAYGSESGNARISEPMSAQRISETTLPAPKMPLVAPPSAPVAVPQLYMQKGSPSAPFAAVEAPLINTGTAVPTLRPKSQRTIFIAFIGALVVGAGVFGYSMMSSSSSSSSAATPGSADEMHATPVETAPPVVAAPAAATPAVAPTKPAVAPTVPETKPTVPETKPTVPDTKPTVPETKPTVPETKPTVPETRPAVPETKAAVVTKPPVTKPVVTKPATVTKPTGDTKPAVIKKPVKPKEQTWDPNSPFLPQ